MRPAAWPLPLSFPPPWPALIMSARPVYLANEKAPG